MKHGLRSVLFAIPAFLLIVSLLPVSQAAASPLRSLSLNFRSVGSKDGFVRESSETSGLGGSAIATGSTFQVGDDAANRQLRGVLHFDTSSIPDTATITAVKLKVHRQGIVGTNPFTTHGALRLDIRKGFFGATNALAAGDFQAVATKLNAGQFSSTPVSGGSAYVATLPASSFQYINKAGTTQFRLRFALDDNNDFGADYLKFFSGDYSVVSDRPELEVEYNP